MDNKPSWKEFGSRFGVHQWGSSTQQHLPLQQFGRFLAIPGGAQLFLPPIPQKLGPINLDSKGFTRMCFPINKWFLTHLHVHVLFHIIPGYSWCWCLLISPFKAASGAAKLNFCFQNHAKNQGAERHTTWNIYIWNILASASKIPY